MGRGNVCTHNECEGLYYLDRDFLDVYRKVTRLECGIITGFDWDEDPMLARQLFVKGIDYSYNDPNTDWHYDEMDSQENWGMMISYVTTSLQRLFKSFNEADEWRGNRHVVLRNALFDIAVVDNEWSAAWCLLERGDVDDTGRFRAIMLHHYRTYLDAIKSILIYGWGEAIGYGGAWTHGEKYTRADIAL